MNNISNTSNTLFTVTNIPLHTFTYIKTFQHPQITINNENNSMTFPASLSSSLYLSIDDSLVRSMMWMQLRSYPQSNIEALCQLIEKRQQLANILGFQSYAHKELSRKVIREPESIMKLLNDASQGIHDVAVNEYTKLHQIKQQSNDTSDIKPWDLSRLMYLYNSTIDNNNVASEYDNMKELQEHLPLYACVESLQLITSSLFGIDTIIETVPDNEKWADDVLKVTLYNSNETNKEFMGTIYLDLLQRNNKFPGSGHFTLSLACDAHDPNLKPIVVLVLNFAESCKPL
jgi:intermediate peptidase